MELWKKLLQDNLSVRELIEVYLELRLHFQELGFSETDLKKPPTYTKKMMNLFHKYGDIQRALFKQIKDYGFDIEWNEFIDYMTPLFEKINEITPLKNGDN